MEIISYQSIRCTDREFGSWILSPIGRITTTFCTGRSISVYPIPPLKGACALKRKLQVSQKKCWWFFVQKRAHAPIFNTTLLALLAGGKIKCEVTGRRENRRNNGLELACKYIVTGPLFLIPKLEQIILEYVQRTNKKWFLPNIICVLL